MTASIQSSIGERAHKYTSLAGGASRRAMPVTALVAATLAAVAYTDMPGQGRVALSLLAAVGGSTVLLDSVGLRRALHCWAAIEHLAASDSPASRSVAAWAVAAAMEHEGGHPDVGEVWKEAADEARAAGLAGVAADMWFHSEAVTRTGYDPAGLPSAPL